ncbi:SUR7/PalI family-domain-containing protein [Phyllosticta citrichinensis]|uniref:SUR7/PalI family-domain-containing protein n=1 Tax=Phyllosticta citrichinensis TaxID=1130410 RepID=A0ABR1Y073_9PEZI
MGKVGRAACIVTPMALAIAALVCLVLVFLGNSKSSSTLGDLYFLKADTSKFRSNPLNISQISGTNLDDELLAALQTTVNSDLKDIYTVGLMNYCDGNKNSTGGYKLTYCSKREQNFWFNPVEVWGLNNTAVDGLLPDSLQNGLKIYRKVAKWMYAAYAVALACTCLELVVGIFAIFSRWGSFMTTFVSTAATIFTIAASITSTALYATIVGTFNSALDDYNITASLGRKMLAVTWLASAFAISAGLFWILSTCCCSGRSSDKHNRGRGPVVEKAPYTYERVNSPFGTSNNNATNSNVPLRDMNGQHTGYEPYSHRNV